MFLQLLGDGVDGCQLVSSDPDGVGSRADVVLALPTAVRHQTPPHRRNHSQGELTIIFLQCPQVESKFIPCIGICKKRGIII